MSSVYGLFDPETGELRYVGVTSKSLKQRLWQHEASARLSYRRHVANWIKGLSRRGLTPVIDEIEEQPTLAEAFVAEAFWIQYFRGLGCALTNLTAGGPGASMAQSPESRAKKGAAGRGRKHSKASRAKMSAMQRNRPYRKLSASHIEAIAVANRGQRRSPEARARMSEAAKARGISLENRAKLTAARWPVLSESLRATRKREKRWGTYQSKGTIR